MTHDDTRRGDLNRFRPAGPGIQPSWRCMGCQQPRPALGSRGKGVHRRCAQCVEAKGRAKA